MQNISKNSENTPAFYIKIGDFPFIFGIESFIDYLFILGIPYNSLQSLLLNIHEYSPKYDERRRPDMIHFFKFLF